MIRLYVPENIVAQKEVSLAPDQVHYLLHVMRCKTGEEIALFNETSGQWLCEIRALSKKQALVLPRTQTRQPQPEGTCVLCPALIKKMDLVIEKAVELGVTEIRPVLTDRSVVRAFNKERAKLIAVQAAEQCERLSVPRIFDPVSLPKLLDMCPTDALLIHLAERSGKPLIETDVTRPWFLIGPEGGFSEEENALLSRFERTESLHLGSTILRAETASLAILACWQFRCFQNKKAIMTNFSE